MTTVEYQRSSRDDVAGGIIITYDDGRVEIIDAYPDEAPAKVAELRAKLGKSAERPAKP